MTCDIMMMINVNGMLRTIFTTPPANTRISGTGHTRMAAKMTPRMNAPIADQKVSWTVIQNAPITLYRGSDRKMKSTPLLLGPFCSPIPGCDPQGDPGGRIRGDQLLGVGAAGMV